MLYIDDSENGPNKNFYYNSEDKVYSPELAVKYIEKELEFEKNSKKVLEIIKSTIFEKKYR